MESGEGLLHYVAALAKAANVGLAPSGDSGQDAMSDQLSMHVSAAVALFSDKGLGSPSVALWRPDKGRDCVDQCDGPGDVGNVPACRDDLEPDLPRSTGGGPTLAPLFSRKVGRRQRARVQSLLHAACGSAPSIR